MPLGKWMIKLHFSSLNFIVILIVILMQGVFSAASKHTSK